MANANIDLYNFYFRYLWNQNDFTGWQRGMVDTARGMFEGLVSASVLEGFALTLSGGMSITAGTGIAVGPTGNLMVVAAASGLTVSAPTGTGIERAVLVVRPNLIDGDYITNPDPNASPFTPVPLTTAQEAAFAVIRGVQSNSPSYPATQPNDVIIAGLRLYTGQVAFANEDIDYEIRDIPGKHTDFQQDAAKYDDRLRPYIVSSQSVGIKPSQLEPPHPRVFSYVDRTNPSTFPRDGSGFYNGNDTFLNFQTGVISGGDAQSADFTPTIPAAGQSVVATVALFANDTLAVAFGTPGTRSQCTTGIMRQRGSGAGSVSLPPNAKPLMFLIVYSHDGANVTELDLFDCRGPSVEFGDGVTTNNNVSPADRSILSGTTLFYPTYIIPLGTTWTVNAGGYLDAFGPTIVNGVLITNGVSRTI